jgi:hypothetical protein
MTMGDDGRRMEKRQKNKKYDNDIVSPRPANKQY